MSGVSENSWRSLRLLLKSGAGRRPTLRYCNQRLLAGMGCANEQNVEMRVV